MTVQKTSNVISVIIKLRITLISKVIDNWKQIIEKEFTSIQDNLNVIKVIIMPRRTAIYKVLRKTFTWIRPPMGPDCEK